jgi:hypothetical protein
MKHQPTQYEVSKTHIAKLESLCHWYKTMTNYAHVEFTVCPHCNRDAVKVMTSTYEIMWIDDADFMGSTWALNKMCVEYKSQVTRKKFHQA